MEALRDLALAEFETFPDDTHEKTDMYFYFKRAVADGTVAEYCYDYFYHFSEEKLVDECMETFMGNKGSLDFNDFVTLNYVLKNALAVTCDGCSSLILGKPYFSCYECFFKSFEETYDLCCSCYASQKFKDHNHQVFYNNQTMAYVKRREIARQEKKQLKRSKFIQRMMIDLASEFMEKARSIDIGADEWKDYSKRIMSFEKNEKLGKISRHVKQLEEKSNAEEKGSSNGNIIIGVESTENEKNSPKRIDARIDPLGIKATILYSPDFEDD